ncbi:MAG: histidine phosphatase family protein, partial [Pseudobutyrivibrio sp.]|nr:histidine phosphatase family protein [Pseudobutyrivibrio sp.]
FFCHYGLTCVLLSRLWNVAPFVPMQFTALAPTSVTEVVTEERQKGIAVFRTLKAGDVSHLALGDEEPSFSARFCERFENEDQRH